MKYKLSIIIPIYGVDRFIERCACSLFEQSFDQIEYIFVNDCTKDNSISILQDVIRRYPSREKDVVIINHEVNRGLATARTTGLDNAHGEYIQHCDSDDWIEPDMCLEMYNKAVSCNADIVACNMWVDRVSSKQEYCYPYLEEDVNTLRNMYLLNNIYSSLCNKIVRKDVYINNNIRPLPNIFMWEDFSVSFRLRYHSRKTVIIPKSFYHYMINNGDSINHYTDSKIQQQIECASFFESYITKNIEGGAEEFRLAINYVKFMSKLNYLTNQSIRDFEKWISIYPESNLDIMKYVRIPLSRRIVFLIGLHGFPSLASSIYDLALKIAR